jgi:hypothetical protein
MCNIFVIYFLSDASLLLERPTRESYNLGEVEEEMSSPSAVQFVAPRCCFNRYLFFCALFLLLTIPAFPAAVPFTETPLDAGYRDMYNLQFGDAHLKFQQWEVIHPDDPMGPVSDAAAFLFSEFERLHVIDVQLFANQDKFDNRSRLTPDAATHTQFENRLNQASNLADTALKKNPKDSRALYVKTLVAGMRSDYALMIDKKDITALSYSKEASSWSKQALAANPTLFDAYLASGVENYMLSLKWGPVRWLLNLTGAGTSRDEGIRLLHLTANQGHYLAPFARMMLAVAALRENRPQEARTILIDLKKEFPHNALYDRELALIH